MSSRGQREPDIDMQPVQQANTACLARSEQYDAKIAALYGEIRRLRESRNADCSATRNLPAEILSMVFRRLDTSKTYRRSVSWVSVTHVCRKWRHIALDEPILWTNTARLPESWLKLFLSRAKNAPLGIRYEAIDEDYTSSSDASSDESSASSTSSLSSLSSTSQRQVNAILESLFSSPERLGKLELLDCNNEITDRLHQPAPNLTALSISGAGVMIMSPNFLGNSAPRLLSFSLSRGSVSMDTSWLRNLRTLHLGHRWGLTNSTCQPVSINTSSFLEFLGLLEKLEDLSAVFVTFDEATHHEYSGAPIWLPNLRKVHFTFFNFDPRIASILTVFDHVHLPAIHTLDIGWPPKFTDSAQIDKVCTFFAENIGQPLRRISCSSLLSFQGYDIKFSTAQDGPTLSFANAEPDFPFQNVGTIEELEIRAPLILRKLLEPSPTGAVSYPSLKQLEIRGKDLKANIIPALKRWLKARKSSANSIKHLIISASRGLTGKDVASLEKLVPITWIHNDDDDDTDDSSSDSE